jgi:hypothetical protein
MPRPIEVTDDNERFPRVNTRVTREALDLLNNVCEQRSAIEPRGCTQGTILTELIVKYLKRKIARNGVPPSKRGPRSVKHTPTETKATA